MTDDLLVRAAGSADLRDLHLMVERAYRGDSARRGWTHEADLLTGPRIAFASLEAMVADIRQRLLVAERSNAIIGCVALIPQEEGLVYLGLLCVDPEAQAGGVGKAIIAAAEDAAITMGANRIEMTVISVRRELIAYYERRGFRRTGEKRPFPVELGPRLEMVVLEKPVG